MVVCLHILADTWIWKGPKWLFSYIYLLTPEFEKRNEMAVLLHILADIWIRKGIEMEICLLIYTCWPMDSIKDWDGRLFPYTCWHINSKNNRNDRLLTYNCWHMNSKRTKMIVCLYILADTWIWKLSKWKFAYIYLKTQEFEKDRDGRLLAYTGWYINSKSYRNDSLLTYICWHMNPKRTEIYKWEHNPFLHCLESCNFFIIHSTVLPY